MVGCLGKRRRFGGEPDKFPEFTRYMYELKQCMLPHCGKEYGSEASLKNHRKLKHGIRLSRSRKQPQK